MILPKGIVVNAPDLNLQIERIDREPLAREDIARFWKGSSILLLVQEIR